MEVDVHNFKGKECGSVVLLGNGPSLNIFKDLDFGCDIIGINSSYQYFPKQKYFVTVAFDRLDDIAHGRIIAQEAVFSCKHKAEAIPGDCLQKIVWVDMNLPDTYFHAAKRWRNIFTSDLTRAVPKTFGGLFAIQVALFLGYTTLYLVGYDGGTEKFNGPNPRAGEASPEYHNVCLSHVADWVRNHSESGVSIYNCSPRSKITWFPYSEPPLK